MSRMARWSFAVACLALVVAAAPSRAQNGFPGLSGFQPQVPVSAFGTPMSGFDASHLHISTSMSVGSGWGGGSTTNALQVTSFSYQFSKPAWLSVSVGNAWGGNTVSGSSMFLEGVRFGFQPTKNSMFTFSFQNVRSPLQMNPYYGWGW